MRSSILARAAIVACTALFIAGASAAEKQEKEYPAFEVGSIPWDEIGKDVEQACGDENADHARRRP